VIVVIDCRDSFVYNLVDYLSIYDSVKVLDIDNAGEIKKINFDGIVISPGPGKPDRRLEFLFDFNTPVLGVCLGHQIIAEVFGGRVEKVKPVHGKVSLVWHDGEEIFRGVRNPFNAGRYHSLAVTQSSRRFQGKCKK